MQDKFGRTIVTQPIWELYSGGGIVGTTIIKQKRIGSAQSLLNLPFSNKHLLFNNQIGYKGKLLADADRDFMRQITAQYRPYNAIFTQSVIVQNFEKPERGGVSISPLPNDIVPVVAQTQSEAPTTTTPTTTTTPAAASAPMTTTSGGGGY